MSPRELSSVEVEAWAAFQEAEPTLATPLVGPAFAKAVGRTRPDTCIVVYRRGGRAVGFLPHHRRPLGLARPVGAVWSDYHALITEPTLALDGVEALRLAGIRKFPAQGLLDPAKRFADQLSEKVEAFPVILETDPETYLQAQRSSHPARFKTLRKHDRKLEREHGAITLAVDSSRSTLEAVFAWKRAQYLRTGRHDVLGSDWSRKLMNLLFEEAEGDLRGVLISLRAGGQLVAAHFGPRQGSVFHSWISSYNPEFAEYSPGQIFMARAIAAMPDLDLRRLDLGAEHGDYKRQFASAVIQVGRGDLVGHTRPGPKGVGAGPLPLPGADGFMRRVGGRLDHISAAEPTLVGRLRGVVSAVSAMRRLPG